MSQQLLFPNSCYSLKSIKYNATHFVVVSPGEVHSVFLNHKMAVKLVCVPNTMHSKYNTTLKAKQFASQNHNELTLSHDNLIYSAISITKVSTIINIMGKSFQSLILPIHYIHCPLQKKSMVLFHLRVIFVEHLHLCNTLVVYFIFIIIYHGSILELF